MYLGIDLGTSSAKLTLIDGAQTVIGSASSDEIPTSRVRMTAGSSRTRPTGSPRSSRRRDG